MRSYLIFRKIPCSNLNFMILGQFFKFSHLLLSEFLTQVNDCWMNSKTHR